MRTRFQSKDGLNPRLAAWAKDSGICRLCGRNVRNLEKVVDRLSRNKMIYRAHFRIERILISKGFNPLGYSLWQADHVLPLAEGGKHSEDNIQLLCIPCHKDKTKDQAQRKKRKPTKRVMYFGPSHD